MEEPPPPGEEAEKSENCEEKDKKDFESDGEGEKQNEVPNRTEDCEEDKEDKVNDNVNEKNGKEEQDSDVVEVENRRRDLHKTSSIFLRNLAPTITKAEVEAVSLFYHFNFVAAVLVKFRKTSIIFKVMLVLFFTSKKKKINLQMCKRYPGFLRVALAEPQAERRWFRRGWVTFERHVNIKEICWNLNNIRLRDCELGAIVNKDLTRRVRTVNGITSHRQVVRHDIEIAAKMTHTLDARNNLWAESSENKVEGEGNAQVSRSIICFILFILKAWTNFCHVCCIRGGPDTMLKYFGGKNFFWFFLFFNRI